MQVSNVVSMLVGASNGGCNTFDVNQPLAAGVVELNPNFSNVTPATLALSIIATQARTKNPDAARSAADCISVLETERT